MRFLLRITFFPDLNDRDSRVALFILDQKLPTHSIVNKGGDLVLANANVLVLKRIESSFLPFVAVLNNVCQVAILSVEDENIVSSCDALRAASDHDLCLVQRMEDW